MLTRLSRIGCCLSLLAGAFSIASQAAAIPPASVPLYRACCYPNRTCAVVSTTSCIAAGGTVQSVSTCTILLCSPIAATPIGPCCLRNGTCVVMSSTACASSAGTWQGVGTCTATACRLAVVELRTAETSSAFNVKGISGDGKTVIGWRPDLIDAPGPQAVVWREADGWLGRWLPANAGTPACTDYTGYRVYGFYRLTNTFPSYMWNQGSPSLVTFRGTPLGNRPMPLASSSIGFQMVGLDQIAPGVFAPFRWSGTSQSRIALPYNNLNAIPVGINSAGRYIATDRPSTATSCGYASWKGTLRPLSTNRQSRVGAMSEDSTKIFGFDTGPGLDAIIMWTTTNTPRPVAYTGDVDVLSIAGCSADGVVIVGDGFSPSAGRRAWVCNHAAASFKPLAAALAQQFPSLNLTGLRLSHVRGISADGRTLCGVDEDPGSSLPGRAWVIRLPTPLR